MNKGCDYARTTTTTTMMMMTKQVVNLDAELKCVYTEQNTTLTLEACQDCQKRVYPLEKISVHGAIYHKKCFKCMECNTILR